MTTDGRVLVAIILQQVFIHVSMHSVDCSFDYGLCGWAASEHLSSDNLRLERNGINGYLHLRSLSPQARVVHLESVPVQNASIQCLMFYYMTKRSSFYNYYSSTLKVVLIYNNFAYFLIQMQEANTNNEWQKVMLNINNVPKHMNFKIRITASIANYDGMYIDNIQVLNGSCRLDCDFEEDLCGWIIRDFRMRTYKNGIGHYLLAEGRRITAVVESTNIYIDNFKCVIFWYQMSKDYGNKIEVLVQDEVGSNIWKTWTELNDQDNAWKHAIVEIEVTDTRMIQLRIIGTTGLNYNSWISVDNISVTHGSCLDCTFSEGFCYWEGDSQWTIKQKALIYTFTNCTAVINESSLTSKSEISPGPKCLSFKYLIQHKGVTYIMVNSNEGLVLSNKTDLIRDKWTEIHASIDLARKSRIAISFVHTDSCYGQNAIMSISLKQGHCTELPSIQVTDKSARKMNEDESSSGVAVGGIVGIVIGCLALVVSVSLVSVYLYRRRCASSTETKAPQNNAVANRTSTGTLRTDSNNQNDISSSTDRNNRITEVFRYNAHTRYATAEKRSPRNSTIIYSSPLGNINSYSLAEYKGSSVRNPRQSHRLKQYSGDTEENNSYDTMHDTKGSLPDSIYNHMNEFRDDTYDRTIPSTKHTLDETYNHTTFKTTLDNTYDSTNVTDDSTYDRKIHSPKKHDSNPTYDLTGNAGFENAYEIIHTTTKGVDDTYDYTF